MLSWYCVFSVLYAVRTTSPFLMNRTLSSSNRAIKPLAVTSPMEKRFTPNPGTYRSSVRVFKFTILFTATATVMSPNPSTFSLASPVPETDQLPGSNDLKIAKKIFWSNICLVAPESTKKARMLLESKVDDEMSAWFDELPPLAFGNPCNLKQALFSCPGILKYSHRGRESWIPPYCPLGRLSCKLSWRFFQTWVVGVDGRVFGQQLEHWLPLIVRHDRAVGQCGRSFRNKLNFV